MPSITLQPPTASTVLSSLAPGTLLAGSALVCGDDSAGDSMCKVVLVKFDLSAIPPGSLVTSASLRLFEHAAGGVGSRTLSLRRVQAAWDEAGATWNERLAGTAWSQPGCGADDADRSAAEAGSVVLDGSPANNFVTLGSGAGLVAVIQGWLDGLYPNHGILLLSSGCNNAGTMYNSFRDRTYTSTSQRPRLDITYNSPDPGKATRTGLAVSLGLG